MPFYVVRLKVDKEQERVFFFFFICTLFCNFVVFLSIATLESARSFLSNHAYDIAICRNLTGSPPQEDKNPAASKFGSLLHPHLKPYFCQRLHSAKEETNLL